MAAAAILTTAIALMPPPSTIGRRALLATAVPLAAHLGLPRAAHADSSGLLRLPMPDRLVAVGDLHGDCAVFERVLRVAGLYDNGRWIGGSAVLVQIGDVLDRGDEELQLLQLLRTLKREAAVAGGAVITMLGNHEVLNAMGISVYASPRSAAAFGDEGERASAFRPGSELATELSSWPVACVVGDTAFIHGGLTLAQVSGGLGDLNTASSDWLKGRRAPSGLDRPIDLISGSKPPPNLGLSHSLSLGLGLSLHPAPPTSSALAIARRLTPPELLMPAQSSRGARSPLWMRDLSDPPGAEPPPAACADLKQALAALGARRLVVGHTVQPEINEACDGSVVRIDVGLSAAMLGAPPQALEIARDGRVRVLTQRGGVAVV